VILHALSSLNIACVVAVQRPYKVKVRAQDVNGETLMLTLQGWQARIFQHEYDHLQVCCTHVNTLLLHATLTYNSGVRARVAQSLQKSGCIR
jgi:peptide deformylase